MIVSAINVLSFIIQNEQMSALNKIIKRHNLSSTKVMARGTVNSQFLHSLGITSDRRTLVNIAGRAEELESLLNEAEEKLHLSKPGHGIAYITAAVACVGMHDECVHALDNKQDIHKEEGMFHKITVIVERGNAAEVMDAAKLGGARGGTIIHGRGSSAEEEHKIFGIEIEPEKEIVMILTPQEITQNVINEIVSKIHIDEPGKGILYVEQLLQAKGLFEKIQNKK